MLHAITPAPDAWDAFVRQQPRGHPLQLSAWGDLKSAFGWSARRVALHDEAGHIVAGAQILFRPLPLRLGRLAYIPYGAYVSEASQWPDLWRAIDASAKGAAFLKWEPGLYPEATPPDIAALGFRPSPQTVQPPRTLLIDLRDDEDAILARMNQGTRRKIRKSDRNEIVYRQGTAADVAAFAQMMHVTGERNAFEVHEAAYYVLAYERFAPAGDAALFLAEHEGDLLGGVMAFAVNRYALNLFSASSNLKRQLMPNYGLQWAVMRWAKARGCRYYDMWGVPDEDPATLEAQFQERGDGLWGVYGFKRGWGGQVIRGAGTWDRIYQPPIYAAYRAALRWRA